MAENSQHIDGDEPMSDPVVPPMGFSAPSLDLKKMLIGESYTYHSPIPQAVAADKGVECVLGVDEAGRGPVLGPMVYGIFYLPLSLHKSLLADEYHFDDSKKLTPEFRAELFETLCTDDNPLNRAGGWATRVMSARDISAGMYQPATYNLNAQAMDATIQLIREVLASGVNVKEIYIDTIGSPIVYQKKLEILFPGQSITVAKKADSLYPCVSAASVCAKVTRDIALESCWEAYAASQQTAEGEELETWGSGYPSDARCSTWLRRSMDPVFGWGPECRFSWGTAKEMLENEAKNDGTPVVWPLDNNGGPTLGDFFKAPGPDGKEADEMRTWYGQSVGEEVF